ncbi:MAG: hypothetical protein JOY93_11430, partial [Acidobacteriales bacterium]|nr:hypothetical protein [Terriglobales bacterium]
AGALLAAHSTCASCGNATPLPGAVAGEVNEALQAAHLDPSQIQTYQPATTLCTSPPVTPACNVTGNNITVCQGVLLNPGGQTQQCGARVSFQYPDSLAFPLINLQSLNIPATADAPMEY